MPARELYIDRLRAVMTALVILHHTAITYGATGGWFWREVQPSSTPAGLTLILFCTINQAYFMGFFFLLAGYFTPGALERKGYARFLGDRFLRLGVPLLAFGLLLGPLTAALVDRAEGRGFWPTWLWLWQHHRFINGPLWFAEALLIFSLGYCVWRRWAGAPLSATERTAKAVPGAWVWLASAVGVGLGAVALRQVAPTGVNVIGLQLGYFSSYVFLFALGIAAWRHDWLRRLQWRQAWPWVAGLAISLPAMPIAIGIAQRLYGPGKANFSGGLSWPAIFYAMWEPFAAWGLTAAWVLVFRARMNGPSRVWAWLNRRAYAVYVIHPPVLVGVSLLLHAWVAPALVKFGVTGTLTCAAAWLLADPLVRMPGLRRIL